MMVRLIYHRSLQFKQLVMLMQLLRLFSLLLDPFFLLFWLTLQVVGECSLVGLLFLPTPLILSSFFLTANFILILVHPFHSTQESCFGEDTRALLGDEREKFDAFHESLRGSFVRPFHTV